VNQLLEKRFLFRRILIVGALALVMLVVVSGRIWPLAAIVALIGLIVAIRWRSFGTAATILIGPFVVLFATGIADWFSQRPQVWGMGLPGMEFFNLNPATRCYRATGGCVVWGGEWLVEKPHNEALKLMCAAFGPPRRTYHGAYPTLEEALEFMAHAPLIPRQEFVSGRFVLDGNHVKLGEQTVTDLLFDLGNFGALMDDDSYITEFRAAVYQKECLIIRVHTKDLDSRDHREWDGLYLFDAKRLKPFARYVRKGQPDRIPRLLI